MIRPDANRIALRATRAILDAAHDFTFELAGKTITVKCTKQAAPAWPKAAQGLDASIDGPWPTPVTVEASWAGGASRLYLSSALYAPNGQWGHAVSLSTKVAANGREVLWITVGVALDESKDGEAVPLKASVTLPKRDDDEEHASYAAHNASLRNTVTATGIPMASTAYAHVCDVAIPGGAVSPDARTAFERAIVLGVAKHAWFERKARIGFTGQPFVDLSFQAAPPPSTDGASAGDDAETAQASSGKRAGIWPLPGGVRSYATTLKALLGDIDEREPLAIAGLNQLFEDRYQATGTKSVRDYRMILRATGFVRESSGTVSLTTAGREWLGDPSPAALFERLHSRFTGMLEALILSEIAPTLATAQVRQVLSSVLGNTWKTDNQVGFRRNWLLSLGLTERTAKGDAITDAGSAVLAAHADDTQALRATLLAAIGTMAGESIDEPDEEEEDDEVAIGQEGAPPQAPPPKATGWLSAHLDLDAHTLAAHLGRLRIDARVLEQLASAVSAGKHVLFVGPPGTGKTELAVALTRAAEAEGYCSGLFTATASADWTTFDTIGGYAMQKDQTLAFRPGAFLRAIQEQKWLLVDELNRADVDRAFGELMTVLAGQGTDTHYELADGRRVSIGAEEHRTFRVPPSFRVLATMNIWDKTSLFRLSYAVQRRFALINVGLPDDSVYGSLLVSAADDGALLPKLAPAHLPVVVRLFSRAGLLGLREIGPAVALDVVRYLRRRGDHADGVAEAIEMFVLPQLQGLGERAAKDARGRCEEALGAAASAEARTSLRSRFRELFPGLGAADD
jgi:5-methylcytosine-specific restriction protein B